MARADLLVKLIKAGNVGDKAVFNKVVEALIAEERNKQHNVVANQLEEALRSDQTLKSPSVSFNKNVNDKIENFLFQLTPHKSLTTLILKEEINNSIKQIIEEHYRGDLLRSHNLEPRNRILLVGEPGNGKTSLAEAVAEALMLPLFIIRYDGIVGSYLGETASRLEKMFNYIKTQQCVLFFDEFDAIGKERGDIHETGEIKRVVSSLLMQIDRLPSYVIIIAATNHAELLDRAVWRRFQLKLELDKPDEKMLLKWLHQFETEFGEQLKVPFKQIVKGLLGLSFAEIEEFGFTIRRKYVLSFPNSDIKKIVKDCLFEIKGKYAKSTTKETIPNIS